MADQGRTKYDCLIAGAGGAGLMAALTLAESRADIKVFEKMPVAGGSTRFPEGMFGAESRMQLERNIRVTKDEAFKAIMEYTHWKANASLVRTFVNRSAGTIGWLEQMGVEFIEPSSFWPGAPRTWHLFKGRGAAMIKVLLERAAEKGIEIQYRTAVKQLIRQDAGSVTGVIVEDQQGRQTRVEAKAVIIATGGYANDRGTAEKIYGPGPPGQPFPYGQFREIWGRDSYGLGRRGRRGGHGGSQFFLRGSYRTGNQTGRTYHRRRAPTGAVDKPAAAAGSAMRASSTIRFFAEMPWPGKRGATSSGYLMTRPGKVSWKKALMSVWACLCPLVHD